MENSVFWQISDCAQRIVYGSILLSYHRSKIDHYQSTVWQNDYWNMSYLHDLIKFYFMLRSRHSEVSKHGEWCSHKLASEHVSRAKRQGAVCGAGWNLCGAASIFDCSHCEWPWAEKHRADRFMSEQWDGFLTAWDSTAGRSSCISQRSVGRSQKASWIQAPSS